MLARKETIVLFKIFFKYLKTLKRFTCLSMEILEQKFLIYGKEIFINNNLMLNHFLQNINFVISSYLKHNR